MTTDQTDLERSTVPFKRSTVPLPVSLSQIEHLAMIPVWHDREPSLAGLFRCSKAHAYQMVAEGRVPALRLGRRVGVPVPALLRLLNEGNGTQLSPVVSPVEEDAALRLRAAGPNTVPSVGDISILLDLVDRLTR